VYRKGSRGDKASFDCNSAVPRYETSYGNTDNWFGQKHIVVKTHLDSITDGPPVKLDKNSLVTFVTDLTNCQIVMEAWNFASELNSSQTLKSVFKRLPVPLQRKCVGRVDLEADEHFAKFNQLVKFVKESAMRTN